MPIQRFAYLIFFHGQLQVRFGSAPPNMPSLRRFAVYFSIDVIGQLTDRIPAGATQSTCPAR